MALCFAHTLPVVALGIIPLHAVGPPYSGVFPLHYWCPSSSAHKSIRREINIGHTTCGSRGKGIYMMGSTNFIQPKSVADTGSGYNASFTNPNESDTRMASYQVAITTSKDYGSGLSDFNAGILLALIGEEGRSLLRRLSPLAIADAETTVASHNNGSRIPASNNPRFQRGSHDVITFNGPYLGKLQAVWIAPERGTWRIEDMQIAEKGDDDVMYYDFEHCSMLIGDGGFVSAAELKASKISLLSSAEYCCMVDETKGKPSRKDIEESRAKGMKEYEMLKLSLLSYDALLVTLGSLVSAGSGHNDIAQGFFAGGMIGFLYLNLLQRAVDRIPAGTLKQDATDNPSAFEMEEPHSRRGLTTFRSPLPVVFAAIFMVSAAVFFTSANGPLPLSKEVLFAGAAGFLMSKVSTVLASSNPLSIPMQD